MIYKKMGDSNVKISILSLGGHEYLPDGRSRGFNENFDLAIQSGYIFEGFGQERRKKVLSVAFEHGINFLDVTQDSEKEALGRNLKVIRPHPTKSIFKPGRKVWSILMTSTIGKWLDMTYLRLKFKGS